MLAPETVAYWERLRAAAAISSIVDILGEGHD